jgi:hypothetical protein
MLLLLVGGVYYEEKKKMSMKQFFFRLESFQENIFLDVYAWVYSWVQLYLYIANSKVIVLFTNTFASLCFYFISKLYKTEKCSL